MKRILDVFVQCAKARGKVPEGVAFVIHDILNEPPSIVAIRRGAQDANLRQLFPPDHVLMIDAATRAVVEEFIRDACDPNLTHPIYLYHSGIVSGDREQGQADGNLLKGSIPQFAAFSAEVKRLASL